MGYQKSGRKSKIWSKMEICSNSLSLVENRNFGGIDNFGENQKFCRGSKIWSKIKNLAEKPKFVENPKLRRKLKTRSKVKLLIENRKLDQKV